MPPKGKKAKSKSVKRPQDSSDTQSDDVIQRRVPRTPAEQPVVIEISDESTSSDQDDQQARESVQKTAKKRQGDVTESHLAKKKQFCQDVVTSVKSLSEKLVSIYKRQKRERTMFHSNYSKSLQSLFQQWDMSVEKVGQEEDSFINSSHQHEKIIYNTMMAQKATIDQAKAISDQFLKNIQELEEKHKLLDALEQNRLENEMKNLKKKLVADNASSEELFPAACGNKYRDLQTEIMQRVRDLGTYRPNQDIFNKSLCSELRKACERGSEKIIRAREDGRHQGSNTL